MFNAYNAPLQMLADTPTAYEKNPEVLNFLSSVPTVWDETLVLDGKIGEYLLIVRKGEVLYIGAMTNEAGREISISFDFLKNQNYRAEIFMDGINADRKGEDYKNVIKYLRKDDVEIIKMAPGGGWVAKIISAQ